jgi:hypothetical protein
VLVSDRIRGWFVRLLDLAAHIKQLQQRADEGLLVTREIAIREHGHPARDEDRVRNPITRKMPVLLSS